MNREKICKNCKYHYIEPISFDYPQSICRKEKDGKKGIAYTTEEWLHCNNFEYSQAYITKLQQENKQLKERIDKAIEYIDEKLWEYFDKRCDYLDVKRDIEEILKGDSNE